MRIRKGDKWKTILRTWYSHFEYKLISFGLIKALVSFQGYINKIFAEKVDIFVIVYQENIFINIVDDVDGYITAIRWVLEQLRKFSLYANLKKCRFHQEEVWFLGYVVSSKSIHMEDKKIEAVKQWPEPQSVQDIQVFLRFANFYWRFIQGFIWIATPLTSILKISGSIESKTRPVEGGVRVDGGRARREKNKQNGSKLYVVEIDGSEVEIDKVGKKV